MIQNVEWVGFRELMKTVRAKCKFPKRQHLAEKEITNMYPQVKNELQNFLAKAEIFAIDLCTDITELNS